MKWTAAVSIVFLTSTICLTRVAADLTEECQARNQTYSISDSQQCDMYYECDKTGKTTQRMCDDGFVFAETIRQCDYPHNVDCTKRPKLQTPQSKDPHCERMNGFYPFPPRESCSKFYHCLEGKAYEKSCPEGVIFDPTKGACVHPDMSSRIDCAAHTVLNFKCPNMNQRFARLRFGDHDRFSHPTDCRKFFICLADGQPRIGGCPFGKVFQQKTGFCDDPKKVTECKDYYLKYMKDGKIVNTEEQEEEEEVNVNDKKKPVEEVDGKKKPQVPVPAPAPEKQKRDNVKQEQKQNDKDKNEKDAKKQMDTNQIKKD